MCNDAWPQKYEMIRSQCDRCRGEPNGDDVDDWCFHDAFTSISSSRSIRTVEDLIAERLAQPLPSFSATNATEFMKWAYQFINHFRLIPGFTREMLERPRDEISFGPVPDAQVTLLYLVLWERLFHIASQLTGIQSILEEIPMGELHSLCNADHGRSSGGSDLATRQISQSQSMPILHRLPRSLVLNISRTRQPWWRRLAPWRRQHTLRNLSHGPPGVGSPRRPTQQGVPSPSLTATRPP